MTSFMEFMLSLQRFLCLVLSENKLNNVVMKQRLIVLVVLVIDRNSVSEYGLTL